MVPFSRVLSRADSELLSELLGRSTVELVVAMDDRTARPGRLRELLLEVRSPDQILGDAGDRSRITDLLSRTEAVGLAASLGLPDCPDPWGQLRQQRFSKSRLSILRAFFGLPTPEEAPARDSTGRFTVECEYGLFDHQRDALRRVEAVYGSGARRAVLHMPTGAGKTRTAMSFVVDHLRAVEETVVFWLANSEELCSQAADEFRRAWRHLGNRPAGLYCMWGEREVTPDQLEDGLVVASLAKVYRRQLRDGNWTAFAGDRTALVVMDEAHQAIAATYKFVLRALLARNRGTKLLGLTATPGRTWNDPEKDAELAQFFHGNKVSLEVPGYGNPVEYLVSTGYLAQANYVSLVYESEELSPRDLAALAANLDIPAEILNRLAEDQRRSVLIVRRVEELALRHKRILVFATTVDHAERVALVLRVRGVSARCITARTSARDRDSAVRWYQGEASETRVLTNYGVLTTGFDAPCTSAALVARPTKSLVLYSQMVGRALRGPLAGGNEEAEIVTVVDTSLPGFSDMAQAFRNWEDVW